MIWRSFLIEVNEACYISVPICSDGTVNLMFEFVNINEINMLQFYLSSKPKRGNSTLLVTQKTTHASRAIYPSRLGGNVRRQTLAQKIVSMEPWLDM